MATLALPEVLTMAQARQTLARLEPALRSGGELTIDASALSELDSAAIAVLLQCRRTASAAGRPLRVIGAPAKLAALASLYGVKDLLGLADDAP